MTRAQSAILWLGFMALVGISAGLQRALASSQPAASIDDPLYISSPQVIRKLSLGYSGLMADIYWTRVVQYFGTKHYVHSRRFDLLAPLLDITTTLDPHLTIAYEYGSTFLAQRPPEGAGEPHLAVKLVERGISEDPSSWRLYYQLGFLYYIELNDVKSAAKAFSDGSKIPGAQPWMKVMAAKLESESGDVNTARFLWTKIYETTEDPSIKRNALRRLAALRSDEDVSHLQAIADDYGSRTHTKPQSMIDLVRAGYLQGVPLDPTGRPYQLINGRVQVADPDALPFITNGLPPGRQPTEFVSNDQAPDVKNPDDLFATTPSNK